MTTEEYQRSVLIEIKYSNYSASFITKDGESIIEGNFEDDVECIKNALDKWQERYKEITGSNIDLPPAIFEYIKDDVMVNSDQASDGTRYCVITIGKIKYTIFQAFKRIEDDDYIYGKYVILKIEVLDGVENYEDLPAAEFSSEAEKEQLIAIWNLIKEHYQFDQSVATLFYSPENPDLGF